MSDAFAVRYTLGMRYTVIFETQPDGGYHAFCPALPGCHSEGDTLDEATAKGWTVVDMKNDWKTVFPAETKH